MSRSVPRPHVGVGYMGKFKVICRIEGLRQEQYHAVQNTETKKEKRGGWSSLNILYLI